MTPAVTTGTNGTGRLSRARSRSLTLVALLAGGVVAVVASAQVWWRASGDGAEVVFKGTEATAGLSQALALVTLAGTLLVLVLKVSGRRVVAVLLILVGIGITLVGALRRPPGADAVRTKLRQISLVEDYNVTATAWPWLFGAAGLVVVGGALLLLVGAPHWPVRPDRFERTGPDGDPSTPAVDLLATGAEDPAAVWKALDAGLDPTVAAGQPETRGPADPDVHIGDTRDTMDANKHLDRSTRTAPPSPSSE